MAIYQIGDRRPNIHESVFVHETAVVIGDVEIKEGASIWPGVVIRGDNEKIVIGANTNVQDGAVIHADPGFPVNIAENVSIGHLAMLHGCTVEEGCLVGIKAVVLNGATIGARSLVGACALVGEGKVFPSASLIIGMPAKVAKTLSGDVIDKLLGNAHDYRSRAAFYTSNLVRIG
ncbi:gamma carbonic anhydrase family protein [Paraburkholderia sp. HD33-4]|uniref:gamma carbonic anhydrase family protein n=1 Tax=Paraburkholderia sp. HD33-4 TaxID=2883242 RepID=UPI001F1A8CFA|nr:gamma carbonic anhydrase family protein [Paraburkholderia sp. HD33-4]